MVEILKSHILIVQNEGEHIKENDTITLGFQERFRRRYMLRSDNGIDFLLDLEKTQELKPGDFLELTDKRVIKILAASEKLMCASSPDFLLILKAAWHIGNRHLKCEIQENQLKLYYDHVIWTMLHKLGLELEEIEGPFNPEGGAYGEFRTDGHTH